MPLDGFTLHFLTKELRRDIVGCRVEKVHQPSKDELVMHLRDRNGAKKLFLSASANSPRVHLTSRAPENPAVPPMFCMLMRKHLMSAQITDVRQNGLDRVLAIDFSATNELGDKVALTLYAEIISKRLPKRPPKPCSLSLQRCSHPRCSAASRARRRSYAAR